MITTTRAINVWVFFLIINNKRQNILKEDFDYSLWFKDLSTAYSKIEASAVLKDSCNDFKVSEELPFVPDGEGENFFLYIEKTGINTEDLSRQIAKFAQVPLMDVGYAGLKDRQGITSQWFSIRIPGKRELDWKMLDSDKIKVLEITKNRKKLKRGVLKGNNFSITLRALKTDKEKLIERLNTIKRDGFPNYFGEQRFGFECKNINSVKQMFNGERKVKKKHLKGLYLSSARGFIFNSYLNKRIEKGNWDKPLNGDVMKFFDNDSIFVLGEMDEKIRLRIENNDICITGPLAGDGGICPEAESAEFEKNVLKECDLFYQGLIDNKVKSSRRALKIIPSEMEWVFENDCLILNFFLPKGSYATSLIREVVFT